MDAKEIQDWVKAIKAEIAAIQDWETFYIFVSFSRNKTSAGDPSLFFSQAKKSLTRTDVRPQAGRPPDIDRRESVPVLTNPLVVAEGHQGLSVR
jgi:hypothetical protein